MRLYTVGHGTASEDELAARLGDVEHVVDVRRFPGSRRWPHLRREALDMWLPARGVDYTWEPRLGGRRRVAEDSADPWWTVEAFRAYAGYTRTPQFRAGLADVLALADERRVAVMCSETVWWRCHRRLIADVVTLLHGREVVHLLPGREQVHTASEGARVTDDGVVWDLSRGVP